MEWQAGDRCIVGPSLDNQGAQGNPESSGRDHTDRRTSGTRQHLLTGGERVPLSSVLSGANGHDRTKVEELLDAKAVWQHDKTVASLCLDRRFDYDACLKPAAVPTQSTLEG